MLSAFLAMSKADSITVDPHKMGYVPYPCGVVAFRNDRVRQFLAETAPYLASTIQPDESMLDHTPPTSIGPYILEGSKPGAAVAGVWLSHRMIPLNRDGYGEIVRASILAARELYERLVHWEHWAAANQVEASFEFMPLTPQPPDTNVVCFLVREKCNPTLARMNELNQWIYERFTIESEYSAGEYSYSQPFFLTHTVIKYPSYSPRSVVGPLQRFAIDASEYFERGLFLLRATIMSPYIVLAEETGRKGRPYLAQFIDRLAAKAEEGVRRLGHRVLSGLGSSGLVPRSAPLRRPAVGTRMDESASYLTWFPSGGCHLFPPYALRKRLLLFSRPHWLNSQAREQLFSYMLRMEARRGPSKTSTRWTPMERTSSRSLTTATAMIRRGRRMAGTYFLWANPPCKPSRHTKKKSDTSHTIRLSSA